MCIRDRVVPEERMLGCLLQGEGVKYMVMEDSLTVGLDTQCNIHKSVSNLKL